MRILAWLKTSKWYLAAVIVGFLIMAAWLKSLEARIVTPYASQGTFSLQMAGEASEADSIRRAWEIKDVKNGDNENTGEKAVDVALRLLVYDSFLFIPLYTGLLFLLLLRYETDDNIQFKRDFIAWLPLVTAVADCAENLLSWLYLKHLIGWSYLLLGVTLLKFGGIVGCIVFMRMVLATLFGYAKAMLVVVWRFRIIVISILFLYLALWQADQGQDLLINLNSHPFGVIVFYTAITVMALLHWHLPKYLSKNTTSFQAPETLWGWLQVIFNGSVRYKDLGKASIKYVEDSDLARGFGVITFLLPAFGILNVLNKYGIYDLQANSLLLITIVLLAITLYFNWIDNAYGQSAFWRLVFHVFLLLVLPILTGLCFLNQGSPKDMVWLFCGLVVLALAFLVTISIRRALPEKIFGMSVAWLSGQRVAGWVMWPALLLGLIFIFANFSPLTLAMADNESIRYSTISIFLCGLVFYVLFFSVLVFWGRSTQVTIGDETRRINVAGIFILMSFLFASMVDNKFHDVALLDMKAPKMRQLSDYMRGWLKDREGLAGSDSAGVYPVFIVSNYGGGVRAAAWSSLMIANLDSLVSARTDGKESFQDHVFAYSGASGGTIGASVMCALRSEHKKATIRELVDFYRSDFLSPVVTGLIGRDFFASTFGLNLSDRARYQDLIWEYHMRRHFGNAAYASSFTSVWKDAYATPLLFANTTLVEKGIKGVVAPVSINAADFPMCVSVMDSIEGHAVKFSTAAFFSARFPFISPAGRVNGNLHFLDGGIYENSGAETAGEVARLFQKILDTNPVWQARFKVFIVSLKNSPPYLPENSNKNLFELSAPLKSLLANVDGNALHADSTNAVLYRRRYYRFYPRFIDLKNKENDTDVVNAILPLGWQLSDQALKRLKADIDNPGKDMRRDLDALLDVFPAGH